MTEADTILTALIDGNDRFRQGRSTPKLWQGAETLQSQNPKAIILGCSDSRVPVEIIFDQGPGDLFVIRVAGNIVAPSQIGSVEFAVLQFNVPLVIVMGHTRCGAINATLDVLQSAERATAGSLGSIVDRVLPNIAHLVSDATDSDSETLSHLCMQANVGAAVSQLKLGSEVLAARAESGGLSICGAFYDLSKGEVVWLN
ncbi:MAG: carbonic anhydrase [Proteobacteria bacterium]|nr:carbonic anhydrase [Pseudomonadota bacterium]